MAWSDITLETDTWTDINIPTLYVTDQNGDIVTDQDGTPMTVQDGTYSLNEWTDI